MNISKSVLMAGARMKSEEVYNKVLEVLEDTTTFGFNEIRLDKNVIEYCRTDCKLRNTVELFCFGTLADYKESEDRFIELSRPAVFKLMQLTLVTESLKENKFEYGYLQALLGLESENHLEKLVTESIYSGLIKAKLFNEQEYIEIYSSAGRDVLLNKETKEGYPENAISTSDLIAGLTKFGERVDRGLEYVLALKNQVLEPGTDDRTKIDKISTSDEQSPPADSTNTLSIKRKRKIELK